MHEFTELLENFRGRRILVIGDAILDSYIVGTTDRLCREAPAPVIQVEERHYRCGGAANTALNVRALGGDACFMSLVGGDDVGRRLRAELVAKGLDDADVLVEPARTTISKQRVCARENILLRLDDGGAGEPGETTVASFTRRLRRRYADCDAVIVSDYGYGLLSRPVIGVLAELRRVRDVPLLVDAKDPGRFSVLRPTAVKPNYDELLELLRLPRLKQARRAQIAAHGDRLLALTGARHVIATLDSEGCLLFAPGAPPCEIPAIPGASRRVIGAGDTFVAAYALALCAGAAAATAARLGAAAAAIVLEKEGTGVCTRGELLCHCEGNRKFVRDLATLRSRIRELKEERKRIVFTNGCFDILHKGHVDFLRQARALGDILVVGLDTDEGIRRIKGPGRPFNALAERVGVLSGLDCVDFLISFDEEGPARLLRALRPQLYVKGATYTADTLPEAAVAREIGAVLKIIPFVEDAGAEHLLARVRELGNAGDAGSGREARQHG